jgi:hypothetical protein
MVQGGVAVNAAALSYAKKRLPVFPCDPKTKRPLTPHGFKDASTDPRNIRAWWQVHPSAMIGMPTGEVSGIFVLDVDVKNDQPGLESLKSLEALHGPLPETKRTRTASGGLHYLFRYPAGLTLVNTAGKLGIGLDTRGGGGYIIVPPSKSAAGDYRFENPGTPLADPPQWLIDLLTTKPVTPATVDTTAHGASAYAAKALEGECGAVAIAAKGERNHILNSAAFSLGRLVGGGELDQGEVESRLLDAALRCGLSEGEARKTIASGFSKGLLEPRQAPKISRAVKPEVKQATALRCVNVFDFLSAPFPEREMILHPIIPRQGLCMLHAPRGVGKTFVALSIAYAVATGGKALRWSTPKPTRVLFIDGEMPGKMLQERVAALIAGNDEEPPDNDYLRILTPDMQDGAMPNLATGEGQEAVKPFLEGVDLVVIDNLVSLTRYGRSNDEESWFPVQSWLLELRRKGLSVLMIHHQGKGGDQRGTSAKEDILDTVIRLDRPGDYRNEQGARFEVRLTKARGIYGDEAKPFEAQLFAEGQTLTWTIRDIEDVELEQLRRLLDDGYTIRDAAEEIGISKSAAGRLKKKLDATNAETRISQGTTFCSYGGVYEQ